MKTHVARLFLTVAGAPAIFAPVLSSRILINMLYKAIQCNFAARPKLCAQQLNAKQVESTKQLPQTPIAAPIVRSVLLQRRAIVVRMNLPNAVISILRCVLRTTTMILQILILLALPRQRAALPRQAVPNIPHA
jgi:hypothetical protein